MLPISPPAALATFDLVEQQGVVTLGWPPNVPLPSFQKGGYPLYPPHHSRTMLQIFVGQELDMAQDIYLESILRRNFASESRETQHGLQLTAYRNSWSVERARHLLQLIDNLVGSYLELHFLDPGEGGEITTIMDAEFGARIWTSFVSGPADRLTDPREVEQIRNLPGLGVLYILPPLRHLHASMDLTSCVDGVKQIIQSATQLRKCILPLDFFVKIEEVLRLLSQTPTAQELELLPPTGFDLCHLLQTTHRTSTSDSFIASIIRGLTSIAHLQSLTIPVSLLTSELLECLSHLPDLLILIVKSQPEMDAAVHFLSVLPVGDAESVTQSPEAFKALTFLDLGLDHVGDRKNPVELDDEQTNLARTLERKFPKTIVTI